MTCRVTTRPERKFREFHGNPPKVVELKSFTVPRTLIKLGRCVAVVYEIDKKNGGGDGTVAQYEHEFETPVGLYMDDTGRGQLYILGPKLKVTKAGIEN